MIKIVKADLGAAGVQYAKERFDASELVKYCDPVPDFSKAEAFTFLPRNLLSEASHLDSVLWSRLVGPPGQEVIDGCATRLFRYIKTQFLSAPDTAMIFDNPLASGRIFKLEDASLLPPFANGRAYMLGGAQVRVNNYFDLIDECSVEWGGGGVVGAFNPDSVLKRFDPVISLSPAAFVCLVYDSEGDMVCVFPKD